VKVIIERCKRGVTAAVEYRCQPDDGRDRPTALDVLLQAQERALPDLAYRYGCRNAMCGVCTIEVNGKPRLACRTRVKDGDRLSALKTLPVIKDLVVRRDEVNRQLAGRLPAARAPRMASGAEAAALHSLNRCIECYACLSECPSHARNAPQGPYRFGNPYSFLRIRKVMIDPGATPEDRARALELARELGIAEYDATNVPGCGMGIHLTREVIVPLQEAAREVPPGRAPSDGP